MADVKVFCTTSAFKDQLISKINSSIGSIPLFDNNYLEVVDTAGNKSLLLIFSCHVLVNNVTGMRCCRKVGSFNVDHGIQSRPLMTFPSSEGK